MAISSDRPRANPEPPRLKEDLDVLRELLAVERARLKVALRIENDRSIIFPETTVIIRDIERLLDAIVAKETGAPAPPSPRRSRPRDDEPSEFDDLIVE